LAFGDIQFMALVHQGQRPRVKSCVREPALEQKSKPTAGDS